MALSYRETYNVALWNSNVELRTAKIKCRLESEKEEQQNFALWNSNVESRIAKIKCKLECEKEEVEFWRGYNAIKKEPMKFSRKFKFAVC